MSNRRFLRWLGLMPVVGGLLLIAALTGFGAAPGQGAKHAGGKTEAMFPHMDAALGFLKAADQQLKQGEPIFHGHRLRAIQFTEAAIDHLNKGINEYMAAHPGTTRNEAIPEAPPSETGDKWPRMQGALRLLQQAESQLEEAARQYNGQRLEGLAETKSAVSEVQAGINVALGHGEK